MSKAVIVRELAVVVVGKNHNPTILNPDFLKVNEIVPPDWELAKPPICADIIAQVSYKNRVTVVSQPDKIVFSEPFAPEGPMQVETPDIARRYLQTVPHVDYMAVGINPKGHVAFDGEESAQNCLKHKFLAKGLWLEYGDAPVRSALRLVYAFGSAQLSLTIDTGRLEWNGESTPVMLFAGNFHHPTAGANVKERHTCALEAVSAWESDLRTFQDLINSRILDKGLE